MCERLISQVLEEIVSLWIHVLWRFVELYVSLDFINIKRYGFIRLLILLQGTFITTLI